MRFYYMKKLALSLLFSTALILHNLSPVGSITNLGPVQIITTNGSNEFAAGTVSLNGTINIGQSASDVITLQGDGITYPGLGAQSILVINENGQILAPSGGTPLILGSLEAAGQPGESVTLGIPSTGNYLQFQNDTGDITLQANAADGNLNLSSLGNIILNSTSISKPTFGILVLSIDNNGNIRSVNPDSSEVIFDQVFITNADVSNTLTAANANIKNLIAANDAGNLVALGMNEIEKNFFGFLNTAGDITIKAHAIGSNLVLSADSYITLEGFGLTNPGLLSIDSNHRISSINTTSAFSCGTFNAGANAGDSISLGINDSSNNNIAFSSDTGSIEINAGVTNATLDLTANAGILLTGSELHLTFPAVQSNLDGYVVLAVDRSNNLTTSNSANVFKMGNDNSGNNFISVDNENTANGILLNSQAIYLANQGLAPASGSSNVLTIDSNGKIGIIVSSKVHKDNIQQIKLDESINSLVPVSYSYKGSDHLEYGFIAEDLAEIPALKNAVIYGKDGKPMSINYQNVFVAVTADHLEVKSEVKTAQADISKVKDELTEMKTQYKKLEAIIAEMIKQGYLQSPTSGL
jgi:hypothetical protein